MNAHHDHPFANAAEEFPLLHRLHPLRKDPTTPEHYFHELEENIHLKIPQQSIQKSFIGAGQHWIIWTSVAATFAVLLYWTLYYQEDTMVAPSAKIENSTALQMVAPVLSDTPSESIAMEADASEKILKEEQNIHSASTIHADTLWDLFSAEELEIYLIENDEF